MIGQYRIDAHIGDGGMGAVYRGTNLNLGQPVAIKMLHPHLARNAEVVARFLNEARILAKLQHPNIVRAYDFVQEDERCAIVMEFIEGTTFDRLLETRGALDWREVVGLFQPLLAAVEYAHAQGVIHRDIKPSNLILQEIGGIRAPKIMDFGIARALGDAQRMTRTGMRMGTVHYMSPEQCRGEKTITHLTDVYSMAVSIYQMLSGRVPFDAESDYPVMQAIINDPPPPIRKLNPDVPPAIEQALARAMAKDPQYRYPSAKAFSEALAAVPTTVAEPRVAAPSRPATVLIPEALKADTPRPARKVWIGVGIAIVAIVAVVLVLMSISKKEAGSAPQAAPAATTVVETRTAQSTPAVADGRSADEQAILAVLRELRDAYASRNADNIRPLVGDQIKYFHVPRLITADEYVQRKRDALRKLGKFDGGMIDQRVEFESPDRAVVHGLSYWRTSRNPAYKCAAAFYTVERYGRKWKVVGEQDNGARPCPDNLPR